MTVYLGDPFPCKALTFDSLAWQPTANSEPTASPRKPPTLPSLMTNIPVIQGSARRWVVRHVLLASIAGLGVGELYRRFYVEPSRQKRRDYYREHHNIDYDKFI
jgi:hypothetical protein